MTARNPFKTANAKIGAAITWVNTPEEMARVSTWTAVAPRVYITSKLQPPQKFGLFWNKLKPDAKPQCLDDLLRKYMLRIPGNEVCIIASPDVELGGNIKGLLEEVDSKRLHNAWAAFDKGTESPETPIAFVLTANIIAQMMIHVPMGLSLSESEWRRWLHAWLGMHTLRPRYFEATSYGIAKSSCKKEDAPVMNAYEIAPPPAPEPVQVAKPAPAPKQPPKRKRITKPDEQA